MKHQDHVRLLSPGVDGETGRWADLGSGDGAFTLALADCLGGKGEITSVDKDEAALSRQQNLMQAQFPHLQVHYLHADFSKSLPLAGLDGIVMANSLHFLREKESTLELIGGYLRPGGRLIVVEYNQDRGNFWVPYPFSYPTWESIARRVGFQDTRMLATYPSRFMGEIYSAASWAQMKIGEAAVNY